MVTQLTREQVKIRLQVSGNAIRMLKGAIENQKKVEETIDPVIYRASIEGIQSQIGDIQKEMRIYERAIASGQQTLEDPHQ